MKIKGVIEMITTRYTGIILSALVYMLPNLVNAEEHIVNAAAREFKPAIIYIQPGDSFVHMPLSQYLLLADPSYRDGLAILYQ